MTVFTLALTLPTSSAVYLVDVADDIDIQIDTDVRADRDMDSVEQRCAVTVFELHVRRDGGIRGNRFNCCFARFFFLSRCCLSSSLNICSFACLCHVFAAEAPGVLASWKLSLQGPKIAGCLCRVLLFRLRTTLL